MPSATQPPGRPPKLDNAVAWRVAALLTAGSTTRAAAADAGVTPRAIQMWRRRAYSTRPADQPYVEFERAIQRGTFAAAELGQPRVVEPAPVQPLDELLANVERDSDDRRA